MDLFQFDKDTIYMDLFQSSKTNGSVSICKIPWVSLNPIHIFIQYIYGSVSTPTTIKFTSNLRVSFNP